jgi:hypothetical protein
VIAWLSTVIAMLAIGAIGVFLVHKTVNKQTQLSAAQGQNSLMPPSAAAAAGGQAHETKQGADECGDMLIDDTGASANKRDLLLPILRQLLSFCTLLGKVGSFQVGSIKAFRTVMHTAAEAAAGVGIGSFWVTCAVQWEFYQRFVVVATLPITIVLLCIVGVRVGFIRSSWRTLFRVWTTATVNLDDPGERRIRCFLDASVIYCLYMAFPTVTQQLFHALRCTNIQLVADGGKLSASYLTADFRVSCGGDNATFGAVFAVGIALVFLYVE